MTIENQIKPTESTHAFNGLSGQNQLNPLFTREGEASDFPLTSCTIEPEYLKIRIQSVSRRRMRTV